VTYLVDCTGDERAGSRRKVAKREESYIYKGCRRTEPNTAPPQPGLIGTAAKVTGRPYPPRLVLGYARWLR